MKRGGTVCGAVSLTVIFCVLCMATFAALAFVTANRERALAELDAQRAAEFYQADFAATRIAAALRSGDRTLSALHDDSALAMDGEQDTLVIDDDVLTIADEDDGAFPDVRYTETGGGTIAEYSVPAGGRQRLDVRLLLRDGGMEVISWKKAYAGEWEADDSLTLAELPPF